MSVTQGVEFAGRVCRDSNGDELACENDCPIVGWTRLAFRLASQFRRLGYDKNSFRSQETPEIRISRMAMSSAPLRTNHSKLNFRKIEMRPVVALRE
jgi:hypothetical protein